MCVLMVVAMMPTMVFAASPTVVTNKVELEQAIVAGGDIVLANDIDLGTSTVYINKNVNIDGGNYTVTSAATKLFRINDTGAGTAEATNVVMKNLKVVNTASNGRIVDTRNGQVTVTLEKVDFKANGSGNPQPITIGGSENGTIVNVKDSKIETTGYAVIAFVKNTLTVDNSDLTGYAALYYKAGSDNSVATVKNGSVLSSKNNLVGASNTFATVVVETADNVKIDIIDSDVKADSTGTCSQVAFGFKPLFPDNWDYENGDVEALKTANPELFANNNTVTVSGESLIEVKSNDGVKSGVESDVTENKVVVKGGEVKVVEGDKAQTVPEELFDANVKTNVKADGTKVVVCETHDYVNGVCKVCETKEPVETPKAEVPKTADIADLMPWLAVMAVTAVGAVALKRKEN